MTEQHQMLAQLPAPDIGAIARDPTELLLRRAENRFQRILEADSIGMLFFDFGSGVLLDANDAFLKMSGYSREEVRSGLLDWQTMTPHEWYDASIQQLEKLAASGRIGPYEKEYYRKDGSRAWMLFSGRELGDGALAEYVIDISGYKHIEAELRASDERQTYLLRLSDMLRPLTASADIRATAAQSLGEHLGLNRVRFADIESDEAVTRWEYVKDVRPMPARYKYADFGHAVVTAFRRGDPVIVTNTKYDPRFDAIEREKLFAAQILSFVAILQVKRGHANSALICHSAVPRDWTLHEVTCIRETAERTWATIDRAEAEAALRTTQQTLQTFYDTAPFMMGIGEIANDRCIVISANRQTAEYFGRSSKEMPGRSGEQLGTPRHIEELWLENIRKSQQEGRPVRFEYRNQRSQQQTWIRATVAIIGIGPTGRTRYSFVTDIVTDRQ